MLFCYEGTLIYISYAVCLHENIFKKNSKHLQKLKKNIHCAKPLNSTSSSTYESMQFFALSFILSSSTYLQYKTAIVMS